MPENSQAETIRAYEAVGHLKTVVSDASAVESLRSEGGLFDRVHAMLADIEGGRRSLDWREQIFNLLCEVSDRTGRAFHFSR